MPIAYSKDTFAFQFDIKDIIISQGRKWVYGSFLLWIQGKSIGDPYDYAVLDHCYGWICDFEDLHMHQDTQEFSSLSAQEIWTLYNKYYLGSGDYASVDEAIEAALNKSPEDISFGIHMGQELNISEFGMSSFDDVTLLMLDYDPLCKRIIAQQSSEPPMEFIVRKDDILKAIEEFKKLYLAEVAKFEKTHVIDIH
ncbi:MAG: hypothetical protein II561_08120 [Thermoguttaceae bacterium]|nr:hypothetical protein [Thermoguttaceae bacterium]MBQ2040454.1 hypothetical protein [Thermoguttaceae bacterium]MBQ2556504.1 hypothetical protein [Thermoguttaceae bacterium]MBQ4203996.1 hypothetical protein [Thermoguttaceae bacterium]MBQ5368033.1 hypothetical protein [Thermoguttaceae bacterium]